MTDYVSISTYKDTISVYFDVEAEKPFALGERLYAVCDMAYMNGYNWAALLDWHLAQTAPELLEGLEADPEAGSYVALYPLSPENEAKAEQLAALIRALVEGEDELFRILREHSDEIEWD